MENLQAKWSDGYYLYRDVFHKSPPALHDVDGQGRKISERPWDCKRRFASQRLRAQLLQDKALGLQQLPVRFFRGGGRCQRMVLSHKCRERHRGERPCVVCLFLLLGSLRCALDASKQSLGSIRGTGVPLEDVFGKMSPSSTTRVQDKQIAQPCPRVRSSTAMVSNDAYTIRFLGIVPLYHDCCDGMDAETDCGEVLLGKPVLRAGEHGVLQGSDACLVYHHRVILLLVDRGKLALRTGADELVQREICHALPAVSCMSELCGNQCLLVVVSWHRLQSSQQRSRPNLHICCLVAVQQDRLVSSMAARRRRLQAL
mmetsp:Transcript_12228/g.42637  ORF Transcript_12228/g.42637 Transcript_12228/m.42637 type:complete len:314 (-) Transcript_12228:620-1561(-)